MSAVWQQDECGLKIMHSEREKKNNSNPPQGQGWHYSVFFLILNKSQESPTLPVSVVRTPVMPIKDVLGQQQSSMAQE